MTHTCDTCGLEHQVDEPTEVVEEIVAADAAVSIAQIEAERDVTLAKIQTKSDEIWQEGRVVELEGELRGLREMLERMAPPAPDPEPVPVVVEAPPEPAAVEEPTVLPPPIVDEAPKSKKRGNPFWENR